MADDFDKDELSWLSNDDDDNSQESPEDDLSFDWLKGTDELPPMQNKVTKRLGITGDLDWQKASGESGSNTPDADAGDSFDWGIFDRAGIAPIPEHFKVADSRGNCLGRSVMITQRTTRLTMTTRFLALMNRCAAQHNPPGLHPMKTQSRRTG